MKKKIIIIIVSLITLVLILVGAYFYGLTSVKKESDSVTFNITKGESARTIINNLYDVKIIRSKISSLIYLKLNKNLSFKPGEYTLDRSKDTKSIFDTLNYGTTEDTIRVTFIEGKRIPDYIDTISKNFGYTKEEILKVWNNEEYLNKLIKEYDFISKDILNSDIYYPLEGYLYPATYEYFKTASIEDITKKMLDKMASVIDNYSDAIKKSGYSTHQILTMASIIENETKFDEDRKKVSQVIYKRLNTNTSLGMDVTTYYAEQKSFKESLTKEDLNKYNAYNTRNTKFLGLPVGPISNPRKECIEAALSPSSTDYFYFYADIKTGKLYFAKTESEFKELIRIYG